MLVVCLTRRRTFCQTTRLAKPSQLDCAALQRSLEVAPLSRVETRIQRLRVLAPLVSVLLVAGSGYAFAFAQVPVQVPSAPPGVVHTKIQFDLSMFNDDGLYGPPGGLRAAAYEFCIPAHDAMAAEVASIDPTVQIYAGSPGRVGCGDGELLCVGSTAQSGFQQVLANLGQLEYVTEIRLSVPE